MKTLLPGSSEKAFNDSPITLEGWILRYMKATPRGKPTIEQTAAALVFAGASHESSPYWVGDILAHAESRDDWKEKFSQLLSITGLAEQTLHNLTSIARRVEPEERELSPSIEHSSVIAKFTKEKQRRWLKRAQKEGWNKREFRLEVNADEKRGVITGQADLEGMFRVWLVDFPWKYRATQPSGTGARTHYPELTIAQCLKLAPQLAAHATKNAVGFFWVTAPMLYENPGPREVIEECGFTPKTGLVWDKVMHTFGNYVSIRHEHLIIATRGSCTPDRPSPMFDSVFSERRSQVHSEKPESVAKMIERLYDGPYLEMFARRPRKGWTTWGNQVLGEVTRKAG